MDVLPPGIDPLSSQEFGFLELRIGEIRFPEPDVRIRTKFWGQDGLGYTLLPTQSGEEETEENRLYFSVRCPLSGFHKYLKDSQKLKVFVTDLANKPLGLVNLNFETFLFRK